MNIKIGTVSSIDETIGTVRVLFDELDGLVSYDLPLVYPATLRAKLYHMPDVDEQVLCLFSEDLEDGYVLGAIYSAKDPVPVSDKDVWHMSIPGGFAVEINRKTREASFVDSYGSRIVFRGGDILIKSAVNIHLNPSDVPIPDHLSRIFD